MVLSSMSGASTGREGKQCRNSTEHGESRAEEAGEGFIALRGEGVERAAAR